VIEIAPVVYSHQSKNRLDQLKAEFSKKVEVEVQQKKYFIIEVMLRK